MDNETFNTGELLVRILENRASQEEILYFSKWLEEGGNRKYFEKFKKVWHLTSGGHANPEMLRTGVEDYRHFMQRSLEPRRSIKLMKKIAAVAAVLLLGIMGITWLYNSEEHELYKKSSVVPEYKGVLLTLSDGKKVQIGDTLQESGMLGENVRINKVNKREIIYEVNDSTELTDGSELCYNQIIVPAGERFFVRLSDGSKVWINSESSLRYPTRFGKDKREVEIRGNVYFEVMKDSLRPFIVQAQEVKTEVLGTSFDVNTYGDRNEVSATLVEGRIRVLAGNHSVIMKPDQRLLFNTNNGDVRVVKVDAVSLVKWKDGILVINNEPFDDVVWKLERWYGVSIVNKTGVTFNQLFSGEFDREDIHAAIETICVNLDITYLMEKDRIVLKR